MRAVAVTSMAPFGTVRSTRYSFQPYQNMASTSRVGSRVQTISSQRLDSTCEVGCGARERW